MPDISAQIQDQLKVCLYSVLTTYSSGLRTSTLAHLHISKNNSIHLEIVETVNLIVACHHCLYEPKLIDAHINSECD